MDYTKEFLLASATGLMGYSMTLYPDNFWQAFTLTITATALFVGRGLYKKYVEKK